LRSLHADASRKCHSFCKAQIRIEKLETKKRIAGHFAGKYKTETTCWTKKTKQRRLRERQLLGLVVYKVHVDKQ